MWRAHVPWPGLLPWDDSRPVARTPAVRRGAGLEVPRRRPVRGPAAAATWWRRLRGCGGYVVAAATCASTGGVRSTRGLGGGYVAAATCASTGGVRSAPGLGRAWVRCPRKLGGATVSVAAVAL